MNVPSIVSISIWLVESLTASFSLVKMSFSLMAETSESIWDWSKHFPSKKYKRMLRSKQFLQLGMVFWHRSEWVIFVEFSVMLKYNNAIFILLSPECSAMGMGQFPICKLKWDLLRTSVTACTFDKNTFSAPFGIFYVRTEIWKEIFQKKS